MPKELILKPSIFQIGKKYQIKNLISLLLLGRIYSFVKNGQTCYESQETLQSLVLRNCRQTIGRNIKKLEKLGIVDVKRRKFFPSTNEYTISKRILNSMMKYDNEVFSKEKPNLGELESRKNFLADNFHNELKNMATVSPKKNYMTETDNMLITSFKERIQKVNQIFNDPLLFKKKFMWLANDKLLEALSATERTLNKRLSQRSIEISNLPSWFKTVFKNIMDSKYLKSRAEKDEFNIMYQDIISDYPFFDDPDARYRT